MLKHINYIICIYSEKLQIASERKVDLPNIVEKEMMGGLTFMVNDKCIGIIKDEMMCRIALEMQDTV